MESPITLADHDALVESYSEIGPRVCKLLCVFSALLFSFAEARAADTPKAQTVSESQLVRLVYIDGDVRFNRGDTKGPDLKKPWEQAVVNLPIESGYALATGDGRAEVEFESGSMVYIAPNSLVLFTNLSSNGGKLDTEFKLVTGTMTLNFRQDPNEHFLVLALHFLSPTYRHFRMRNPRELIYR